MKIYIAGPMSGYKDDNYPLFHAVAERLRHVGFDVVSPAEGVADPETQAMSQRMGADFRNTREYRELIVATLELMRKCDGVCTLTGWHLSNGASKEVIEAQALGLPVGSVDWWLDRPPEVLKYVGPEHLAPEKKIDGDAGYDLYVAETTVILYQGFSDVPLGIHVELPSGVWAMLTGRSSTIRTRQLLVTQGIIDNGYRGPLFAGVQNVGPRTTTVEKGERIAQLIPFRLENLPVRRVAELSMSARGPAGFGSTGV